MTSVMSHMPPNDGPNRSSWKDGGGKHSRPRKKGRSKGPMTSGSMGDGGRSGRGGRGSGSGKKPYRGGGGGRGRGRGLDGGRSGRSYRRGDDSLDHTSDDLSGRGPRSGPIHRGPPSGSRMAPYESEPSESQSSRFRSEMTGDGSGHVPADWGRSSMRPAPQSRVEPPPSHYGAGSGVGGAVPPGLGGLRPAGPPGATAPAPGLLSQQSGGPGDSAGITAVSEDGTSSAPEGVAPGMTGVVTAAGMAETRPTVAEATRMQQVGQLGQYEAAIQAKLQQIGTGDAQYVQLVALLQNATQQKNTLMQQIIANPQTMEEKSQVALYNISRLNTDRHQLETEYNHLMALRTRGQLPMHSMHRIDVLSREIARLHSEIQRQYFAQQQMILNVAALTAAAATPAATGLGPGVFGGTAAAVAAATVGAAAAHHPSAGITGAHPSAAPMVPTGMTGVPPPGLAAPATAPVGMVGAVPTTGAVPSDSDFHHVVDLPPFVPEGIRPKETLGEEDDSGITLNPEAKEFQYNPPGTLDQLESIQEGGADTEHDWAGDVPQPEEFVKEYSQFDEAAGVMNYMTDSSLISGPTTLLRPTSLPVHSSPAAPAPPLSASPFAGSSSAGGTAPPISSSSLGSGMPMDYVDHSSGMVGGSMDSSSGLGARVSGGPSSESDMPGSVDEERSYDLDKEYVDRLEDRELDSGLAVKYSGIGEELVYDLHYLMERQRIFFNPSQLHDSQPSEWAPIDRDSLKRVEFDSYPYIASLGLSRPSEPHSGGMSSGLRSGLLRPKESPYPSAGVRPAPSLTRPEGDPDLLKQSEKYQFGIMEESRSPLQKLKRKLVTILNKVTLENFDLLKERMASVLKTMVDSREKLEIVVAALLNKASEDPSFSSHYAELCRYLLNELQNELMLKIDGLTEDPKSLFRKMIVEYLQKEMNHRRERVLSDVAADPEFEDATEEEMENEVMKRKKRFLGVVTMVAQLNMKKVMKDKTISTVLDEWVSRGDSLDVESFCKLVKVCGERMYRKEYIGWKDGSIKSRPLPLEVCQKQMHKHASAIDTRLRFMVEDISMNMNSWFREFERSGPSITHTNSHRGGSGSSSSSSSSTEAFKHRVKAHLDSPQDSEVWQALRDFLNGHKMSVNDWADVLKQLLIDSRLERVRYIVGLFGKLAKEGLLPASRFTMICEAWSSSWSTDLSDFPILPEFYGRIVMAYFIGYNDCPNRNQHVKSKHKKKRGGSPAPMEPAALLCSVAKTFLDEPFARIEPTKKSRIAKAQRNLLVKFVGGLMIEAKAQCAAQSDEATEKALWTKLCADVQSLSVFDTVDRDTFESSDKYKDFSSDL